MTPSVSKNDSEHTSEGWYPFDTGDTISTGDPGEAELNLSECWSGRLYVFDDSSGHIHAESCREADFNTSSIACVQNGTWYAGQCRGEFSIATGSAIIHKLGTSFSVTALPEVRETTLVIVLEGEVIVEPVLSYGPTELGEPAQVTDGQFYFTMPDGALSPLGDLRPRQPYPVSQLGRVAGDLGIREWMIDIHDQAQDDGVLPGDWPPDLGGPGEELPIIATIRFSGEISDDPIIQEAVASAIDWQAVLPTDQTIGVSVGSDMIPAGDFVYNPEFLLAMMEERGYEFDIPVLIAYFQSEERMARIAQFMADSLSEIGMFAIAEPMSAQDLEDFVLSGEGWQIILMAR